MDIDKYLWRNPAVSTGGSRVTAGSSRSKIKKGLKTRVFHSWLHVTLRKNWKNLVRRVTWESLNRILIHHFRKALVAKLLLSIYTKVSFRILTPRDCQRAIDRTRPAKVLLLIQNKPHLDSSSLPAPVSKEILDEFVTVMTFSVAAQIVLCHLAGGRCLLAVLASHLQTISPYRTLLLPKKPARNRKNNFEGGARNATCQNLFLTESHRECFFRKLWRQLEKWNTVDRNITWRPKSLDGQSFLPPGLSKPGDLEPVSSTLTAFPWHKTDTA